MQDRSNVRRSNRIAKQVPLVVRWQPAGRDIEDDPVQTVQLSKHGCSFTCSVPLKIGAQVYVMDPVRGASARARVVFRGSSVSGREPKLAVEFLQTDDFWGLDFAGRPQLAAARA